MIDSLNVRTGTSLIAAAGVFLGAGVLTPTLARAQAAEAAALEKKEPEKKEPEKKEDPEANFSPELQKKLKEFYGKVNDALIKVRTERMDAKIAEVAKLLELDQTTKNALKEPAKEAAKINAERTTALMRDTILKQYRLIPDQYEEMIDQLATDPEQIARSGGYPGETSADQEAVWTEGLKKVLTPEQWDKYSKSDTDRVAKIREEIDGVVKASIDNMERQYQELLTTKSSEVKLGISLPEDRQKLLEEGVERVSKAFAAEHKEKIETSLLNMPEQNRKQVVKQGRFYMGIDDETSKKLNEAWEQHVAKVLTPEEAKKITAAQESNRVARAKAMGLVMISLLDEHVAFNQEQRERLIPVAEKLVSDEQMFFPSPTSQYFNVSTATFFTVANKLGDDVLKPILNDRQFDRWRASASKRQIRRMAGIQINRAGAAPKKDEPLPYVAPEEVEEIMSDFLIEREGNEREQTLAAATLKAEEIAQILNLAPEASARLEIAAKGVVELALNNWRANIERNIRSQISNLNPQQIRQRLASMENYEFYMGRVTLGENLWEKTVKEVLSPEQHARLNEELEHRKAFRRKAAAAAISAEFNRKVAASEEQLKKVEGFLTKFIEEYSPDIESMFSPGNSTPWFLATYSALLPFGSLDDKQALEYMTKDQWDKLKGSNEFSNATNYWENIQQTHKARMKRQDENKKPS